MDASSSSSTFVLEDETMTTSAVNNNNNNNDDDNGMAAIAVGSSLDDAYMLEVARRSVARAALHMDIQEITDDALDALAHALLDYMSRLGEKVGSAAEESGRSSAHVSLLDVFHGYHDMSNGFNGVEGGGGKNYNSWEDLARFAFGDDWHKLKSANVAVNGGETDNKSDKDATSKENGGTSSKKVIDWDDLRRRKWDAPYLDEVPFYPLKRVQLRSFSTAPSQSQQYQQPQELSLSSFTSELDSAANDSFYWGTTGSSSTIANPDDDAIRIKTGGSGTEDQKNNINGVSSPAAKRAKADSSSSQNGGSLKQAKLSSPANNKENGNKHHVTKSVNMKINQDAILSREGNNSETEPNQLAYRIPNFCPPIPPPHTYAMTSSLLPYKSISTKDEVPTSKSDARDNIVRLSNASRKTSAQRVSVNKLVKNKLMVPSGERKKNSSGSNKSPLQRPSGSRISKILEGSMDVS